MNRLLLLLLLASPVFAQQSPAQSSTGNITAAAADCLTTNVCINLTLIPNTSSISVTLTGTFVATLKFEKSADNGVTWANQDTQTGTGLNTYNLPALTNFRVRASAYTSGTVGVFINTSTAAISGGSGTITAGTTNKLSKYTAATTVGNSLVSDDGTTLTYTGTGGISSTPTGGIGGTLTLPEGTAATASAGNDVCYGDSGTHSILCSFNNGSFGPLGGASAWSALTAPSGALSLTMAGNTSTFNTTTALSQFFAWKNTTAAIVGTSQGSPVLSTCGRAFHGSADVEDCMTFKELPGNGNDAAIVQTIGHTGTSTGFVNTLFSGGVAATPTATAATVCSGTTNLSFQLSGAASFTGLTLGPNAGGNVFCVTGTGIVAEFAGAIGRFSSGYELGWANTTNPDNANADIGIGRGAAGVLTVGDGVSGNANTTGKVQAAGYMSAGTKFTASGCSNGTTVGGATAGRFASGITGACTVTITMGNSATAPNGWSCWASDQTTPANIFDQTTGGSTTTAVITGTTVSGDTVSFGCVGY